MTNHQFWQGIEQFNQQEFYACHDTLEALWMEACDPDKTFYQGILQIAVACYHLSNRNWNGSVMLLGEGIRRLRNYQPIYSDINVTGLVEQSASMLTFLQHAGSEQVERCAQRFGLVAASGVGAPNPSSDDTLSLPKIEQAIADDESVD